MQTDQRRALASSYMHGQVVTIDQQATLRAAAMALRNATIGTLAIMAGDEVAGIVSERDIVRALTDVADPDEVWVGDVMSEDPRYTGGCLSHQVGARSKPRLIVPWLPGSA